IRELIASGLATEDALVQALGNHSWYAIVGHAAQEAIEAADEAIGINSQADRATQSAVDWIMNNRGHALLVLGARRRAIEQYEAAALHQRPDGQKWIDVIRNDLVSLGESGVAFEALSEAEATEIANVELGARNER